jgi:hypothetical protein
MVPTEYADVADSAYKRALREQLDSRVLVEWTGIGVIAHEITPAQAASARQVFGHDILVWDNYPVNDYGSVWGRLLLAPYVNRSAGLSVLEIDAPAGWSAEPASTAVTLRRGDAVELPVTVTAPDAATGAADMPVTFTAASGERVSATVHLEAFPRTSATNVARSGVATASSIEVPQFGPENAIDGDPTTRWSSGYADGEWLQVRLAEQARIGKVVLRWETAYGRDYRIQVSDDGATWRTVADVTGSDGGQDVIRFDATAAYVRMQGVRRATGWGYSLYELEAYPVA